MPIKINFSRSKQPHSPAVDRHARPPADCYIKFQCVMLIGNGTPQTYMLSRYPIPLRFAVCHILCCYRATHNGTIPVRFIRRKRECDRLFGSCEYVVKPFVPFYFNIPILVYNKTVTDYSSHRRFRFETGIQHIHKRICKDLVPYGRADRESAVRNFGFGNRPYNLYPRRKHPTQIVMQLPLDKEIIDLLRQHKTRIRIKHFCVCIPVRPVLCVL